MSFYDILGIKCKAYNKKVFKLNPFSNIIGKFTKITILVEAGEDYKLIFAGNENLLPTFKVEDNTLYIEQTHRFNKRGILANQILKIIVPATMQLQNCHLFNKLGNIDLINLKIKDLQVNCQAGLLRVCHAKIERADLKINRGNLAIHSSEINKGLLSTYEGEVKVLCSSLTDVTLDVTDGNIIMTDNTLKGGSSQLYSGNIALTNVTLKSDYGVKNNAGNNTAYNVNVKKADLQSENGNNTMKSKLYSTGFTLKMVTLDGDNIVQ